MPIPRFATAALLAASLGLPALGQIQVQQGGALDANPQVGSGGFNRIENQVDYQARNLLVTGNSAGGRSFRDSIGYTNPGQLRTNLGSDSLYNFRRDSLYSAPQALGIRAQSYGNRVIVTRASSTAPGQLAQTGYGLTTRTTYDPRSGTVSFRQNSGGLVRIEGVRDLQDLTPSTNVLATIRTRDGGLARIQASPLNGLQINPLSTGTLTIDPRTNRLVRPDELNQPRPQNQTDPDTEEQVDPDDPRLDRRYINPDDPRDPTLDEGDDSSSLRVGDRVAPTLVLGNQLQQQLAAQAIDGEVRDFDAQVEQLQQQMFGPLAVQPAEGEAEGNADPYQDLIARILADATPQGQDPDEGEEPEGGSVPPWEEVFDEPDQAVQDAIDQLREDAIRRALGMVDQEGNIDRDTPLPTVEESSRLAELIDTLDYDLPRVQTLAGDRENRLNTLMTRGEQELAAGKFLAAENVYRQILRESGDNPLAKAGLIHSQLGAGMFRSAAFNMRALFSEHPELIALRYDAKLLPATERLTRLQRDLQEMIGEDNHSAEPGLVLAYLGYQLEAEPLVTYGLAVAEARAPRDPLMPILRQIWLEADPRDAEDEDATDK
ncbi:MAG: hypothetical protein AAGC44_02495 [Planctomycetota bacterium]